MLGQVYIERVASRASWREMGYAMECGQGERREAYVGPNAVITATLSSLATLIFGPSFILLLEIRLSSLFFIRLPYSRCSQKSQPRHFFWWS